MNPPDGQVALRLGRRILAADLLDPPSCVAATDRPHVLYAVGFPTMRPDSQSSLASKGMRAVLFLFVLGTIFAFECRLGRLF
jgi:hypothetical protein